MINNPKWIQTAFSKQYSNEVLAGFTLANKDVRIDKSARINGFNMGLNKLEKPEIVQKNREHFFSNLLGESPSIASARQVHGSHVQEVHAEGVQNDTDALISSKSQLLLLIQIADCAPIILYNRRKRKIAAIHAGWKGAVADILPETLEQLCSDTDDIPHTFAAIGPCISKQAFEVGEEVAEQFPNNFIDRTIGPKPHVDLKAFLRNQLLDFGLHQKSIEVDQTCTFLNNELCYSHRKSGEKAGRMAAFIMLR